MTSYRPPGHNRGDVVLVPFPFTDLRGQKVRPALILSNDGYNAATRDVILAMITGNVTAAMRPGDYLLTNWQSANLVAPSIVRAKLTTVLDSRIHRVIGQLSPIDLAMVEVQFKSVLAL